MTTVQLSGDPTFCTSMDSLSLSACFLDLFGVGSVPRHATGFFWRHQNDIYLITNWHVVTGKNVFDGNFMSHGWYPERMTCNYFAKTSLQQHKGSLSRECHTLEIELDFVTPPWLQHAEMYERDIDIVALKLSCLPESANVVCVNDFTKTPLLHFAGRDIFILGHPIPRKKSAWPIMFPVWKRGSLATELIIPWNMRPAFLIDSRTTPGMSGSAVFAKDFGPTFFGPTPRLEMGNVVSSEFMGVYSGRVAEDDRLATLGIVWHRHLIDQIIEGRGEGSREWYPSTLDNLWSDFTGNAQSKDDVIDE